MQKSLEDDATRLKRIFNYLCTNLIADTITAFVSSNLLLLKFI